MLSGMKAKTQLGAKNPRRFPRIVLLIGLMTTLGVSVALGGPDGKATAPAKTKQAKVAGDQKTEITGFRTKHKVKRVGNTTDTALNVAVIDRREIERSGAFTLAGVLTRQPSVR